MVLVCPHNLCGLGGSTQGMFAHRAIAIGQPARGRTVRQLPSEILSG
ncbi:unnamed protein product [Fusarium graminearum]|uniref:Chromosome 1, complete genome n=1 Tax=Gibberella zeae (strain ATCC MYA-4620 / CBS 123657 / FGSC 9075 / NRRL 31084 / PH-1) TaxID=229533 RepID=A0A0E0RWI4_GIBZE|nr:hypothetical protein FG05_35226 [Fusarium graminearum]CEF75609.1 unnamed protein product [Fusarium graminearum]